MRLLSNFLTYFLHIVNAFLTNYGLTYVQNKANTTAEVQSNTTPARATIRWIALPSQCIVGAGLAPSSIKEKRRNTYGKCYTLQPVQRSSFTTRGNGSPL